MSREILFRGKRINNGEWVYGYLARFRNVANEIYTSIIQINDYETQECSMQDNICVIPETVGQYAGLIDKHGNKIFEDDIIKVNITQAEDRKTYGDCAYKIGVIVYNEDFALFSCKNNFMNFTNWAFNDYEVIGNFHDNKELLGE